MDTVIQAVSQVIMVSVAILLPFVAYPFAFFLNNIRFKIDMGVNWVGDDDGKKERREDAITHFTAFLLALVSLIVFGALYIAWFQSYVADAFDLPEGKTMPAVYWAVVYSVMFLLGWYRCSTNRKNSSSEIK